MQIVKYGKKQRTVKVPTDWAFVLDGVTIMPGDKFFNSQTHCWDDVKEEYLGKIVGKDVPVVVRKYQRAFAGEIEKDTRAIRVVL